MAQRRRYYGFNPAHVGITAVTCALRTLDSFRFEQAPYFMKIDAQGHESAVLAGGAATLASARPVVMVEGAWRDPAIAAHLRPHGYAQMSSMASHLSPPRARRRPRRSTVSSSLRRSERR